MSLLDTLSYEREELGTEQNELQRPKRREKQDCLKEEKLHFSKID